MGLISIGAVCSKTGLSDADEDLEAFLATGKAGEKEGGRIAGRAAVSRRFGLQETGGLG